MGLFTRRATATSGSLQAAARVMSKESRSPGMSSSNQNNWQKLAWQYFDSVGELHYASSFIASCLSRCVLTIGIVDDEGKTVPGFDDEGTEVKPGANEALLRLRELKSEVGGQSELLRAFGLNLTVVGEAFLVGTDDEETAKRSWEILSSEELVLQNDGTYKRGTGLGATIIDPNSALILRVWRRHARSSSQADSSVRPLLDVLEEMVLLQREIRGELVSRLANTGLLVVAQEMDFVNEDGTPGSFVEDFMLSAQTAIEDKGTAAQAVPYVADVPMEFVKDGFNYIQFEKATGVDSAVRLEKAVQRFAQGIDLPLEVVTGTGAVNHWGSWNIDESTAKAHIEPLLELICDALTVGFLRPELGPDTEFVVHYDTTELVSRPDRFKDTLDAFDRYAVSFGALRDAGGFPQTDAPDDAELERRLLIAQALRARTSIQETGSPTGQIAKDITQTDPNSKGIPAKEEAAASTAPTNGVGPVQASAAQAMTNLSIDRAVQRVGAKLKSQMNGKPRQSIIRNVPNAEVAATLGQREVEAILPDNEVHRILAEEFNVLSEHLSHDHTLVEVDDVLSAAMLEAKRRLYGNRGQ